jgi:hypothetical protein
MSFRPSHVVVCIAVLALFPASCASTTPTTSVAATPDPGPPCCDANRQSISRLEKKQTDDQAALSQAIADLATRVQAVENRPQGGGGALSSIYTELAIGSNDTNMHHASLPGARAALIWTVGPTGVERNLPSPNGYRFLRAGDGEVPVGVNLYAVVDQGGLHYRCSVIQ